MTDINAVFDNLTGVNEAKDFDQSQTQELGTLDVPDMYQEFEVIEHEIDRSHQSVSEIALFSERLADAKVVRRDDVYAFESLAGKMDNLPHINSYTMDYTMVNYQVTQESVFTAVNTFVKNLAKLIWKYIGIAYNFVVKQLSNAFNRLKYVDDTAKQETVKKDVVKATDKTDNAQSTAQAKASQLSDKQVAARIVGINKQLRGLLYPKFKELGALSVGGQIKIDLLVDEMCEQRLKPFYSTFYKAIYERDLVLSNTVSFLTRRINSDFILLINKTASVFDQDITLSPTQPYDKIYREIPEQINDYLKHFGNANLVKGSSYKDDYKDRMTAAYDLSREITSISVTHDLPESRAILKLDLEWLGDLFSEDITAVGRDIQSQFADMSKSYKIIERNSANTHPDIQTDMMALYSDWIVLNKMATMLSVFRIRADSIYQNIDLLSNLIIEVTEIATA